MDQATDESPEMQEYRRKEWVALFDDFATERGVEQLDNDKITELMRVCGADPTDEEVDEYMKEADKNDDRLIDCEEFCCFMEKQMEKGDPEQLLKDAFDFYDKDGSGFIERCELKAILEDCGQNPDDEDLIDALIQSADINGDGKIDITEFVHRIHNVDE